MNNETSNSANMCKVFKYENYAILTMQCMYVRVPLLLIQCSWTNESYLHLDYPNQNCYYLYENEINRVSQVSLCVLRQRLCEDIIKECNILSSH